MIAYNLPLYPPYLFECLLERFIFSKERLLFNKIGIYLVGRKVVYEYEVIPVVHEVNILSS